MPREQQLLAHASDQRRILASRDEIKARLAETAAQFPVEVPWTAAFRGYRLEIDEMELWQGRTDNVHDRFRYQHTDGGGWRIEQLAP